MSEELSTLIELVSPPTNPEEAGYPLSRDLVETGLGYTLPEDIYEFFSCFGNGTFETGDYSNLMTLFNPFLRTFFKDVNAACKVFHEKKRIRGPASFPYNVYPEFPGLCACGSGEDHRFLFLSTHALRDGHRVALVTPDNMIEPVGRTVVGFLVALISGNIGCFGGGLDTQWFHTRCHDIKFVPLQSIDVAHFPEHHLAASAGWSNELKKCLDSSRDANTIDYEGRTSLFHAIERSSITCVTILLEAGADPNWKDTSGITPLYEARCGALSELEVIRLLLDHGAMIDSHDMYGTTPLMLAAQSGSVNIVRLLLERGANVNARTTNGSTPLWFARNDAAVKSLLITAGATT